MRSIGSLTLDMNCADRAHPYPTPFPTAPNHTTPYNPLQPPTTATTPPLQQNTMPPPFYPHSPQYSTTQPPPARDLFPGRWVPSIQRSVYFAYSQKCQHQASFCSFAVLAICLLWFYSSLLKRTLIIFIDITGEDSLHLIWRAARPWSPEMSTPGQHSCPSPF